MKNSLLVIFVKIPCIGYWVFGLIIENPPTRAVYQNPMEYPAPILTKKINSQY